jgi:TRAP transporter TAXI family solute receptor
MRVHGATLLLISTLVSDGCGSGDAVSVSKPVVRLVRDATIGEPLEREFVRRLPGIDFVRIDAVGSVGTVEAIQLGKADVGFLLGDVAYFAHLRSANGSAGFAPLRGMVALKLAPIHLVVRRGLRARDIRELRGRRIGVGSALSGQPLLTGLIFQAYRLGHEVVQPGPRVDLLDGVDASFATGYYPVPIVTRAMSDGGRLLPLEGDVAEHLRREYPFVQPVTIPAGTYPGQSVPIRTIGVDRLLVCRRDLDDRVVHDLTRQFLEALPSLTATVRNSLRLTDLALASATSIPLHEGAAQYYRERELTR